MPTWSPVLRSLFSIAVMSVFVGTSPAVADTKLVDLNTTMPLVFSAPNPCKPGSVVAFEGFSHLHFQTFLTDAATLRFKIRSNSHAAGKDAVSGLMYVTSSERHSDFTLAVPPESLTSLTERTQSRVISQGPEDNFFMILKITFDIASGTPIIETETACRG